MSMKNPEPEEFDEDLEKEKRKISELFREIKTKGEKEDDKLTWMYKNPVESVDREDYLLGRSVDKALDSASGRDTTHQHSSNHGKFRRRGRNDGKSQADQAEIHSKLHEDPLFAIRQKEIDFRKKLLSNPVKMKEVKKMIEEEARKKMKAEKKWRKQQRKIQKDKKINLLLIKELRKHSDKLDYQAMLNSSTDSSSSESDEPKKKKRTKRKREVSQSSDDDSYDDRSKRRKTKESDRKKKNSGKVEKRSKSKREKSSERSRTKTKNVKKKKNKSNRSESSSSDSDSSDDRKSKPKKKTLKKKKLRKSSSESSSESDSSESSSDDEKKKKKDKKEETQHTSKLSRRRVSEEKTKDIDDGDEPKKRKAYGLSTLEGTKPNMSEKPITPYKKKEEEKPKVELKPMRLSEKEKEAKLREMMENAKWRKKERESDYVKHKKAKQREEKIDDYDESFIKNQLAKMSRKGSMADRIKSNINNIQRSSSSMDNNFVRK